MGAIRRFAVRRPLLSAIATFGVVILGVGATLGARELVADGPDGPAPQTTKKLVWGLRTLPAGGSLFPAMKDLGVGIYAIQARWEMAAPTRRPENPRDWRDPAYEWPEYLAPALREADQHGMEVMLMVMGTPKWANGGRPWYWHPDDPQDFADFTYATTKRYPNVKLWKIWGEPNRMPNFRPLTPQTLEQVDPDYELTAEQQVAPRNYSVLLDTTYEELKREDPKNIVIGGSTYTSAGEDNIRPYQWLEYMKMPDGSRPRMDMWGHNPWGNERPDLDEPPSPNGTVQFSDLGRLVKALDRAGYETEQGKPLKLFLSEWGIPTGFEDKDLLLEVDDESADKWIQAAFNIADWNRIYTLGWVHLTDTDRNSTGLLTEDGRPKPAFDYYKSAEN
jgi:hypothetical protein